MKQILNINIPKKAYMIIHINDLIFPWVPLRMLNPATEVQIWVEPPHVTH